MKKKICWLFVAIFLLVQPVLAQAQLSPGDFIDIRGHWAEQEIENVCTLGLMNGTGVTDQNDKIFLPEGTVNRAQLAVVLERTFKLDFGNIRFFKAPVAADYFWDIEEQEWFAEAAMMCAINQVFASNTELKPMEEVTRIEVARTIYRSFLVKNINFPMILVMPQYADTRNLSQEDINAMVFVSNTGIMKGNEQFFRPQDLVTRAELAKILNRCASLIKDNAPSSEWTSSLQMGVKEIDRTSDTLHADLNIPVLQDMQNQTIQKALNDRFEQETVGLQDVLNAEAAALKKDSETNGYGYVFHPFELVTRCGPYFENGQILSLYVDYYSYTGGAHGITDRRAYNINLLTGEALKLENLFVKGYDYKVVIDEAIRQKINLRPGDYFSDGMGFQGISKEQGCYLQNDCLIIYFSQYEIAPYVAGIPTFSIPLSRFGEGLNPEFLK